MQHTFHKYLIIALAVAAGTLGLWAQAKTRRLITRPIRASQRVMLPGNTPPLALARYDRGPAPAGLSLQNMLLVLKRSPAQAAALRTFLAQVQDSASPDFHHWLTPAEYGAAYGLDSPDIAAITAWLRGQGFSVSQVAQGRGYIEFSGNAGQVRRAFAAAIHKYVIGRKSYWANSSDPSIPAALAPAVAGIVSLNSFRRQPQHVLAGIFRKTPGGAGYQPVAPGPDYTFSNGNCGTPSGVGNCYALAPADLAIIYNATPLASQGLNGAGETIAIPGRSSISVQDIQEFRGIMGLPALSLNVIGFASYSSNDALESTLDVEWAGALAPAAAEDLVTSENTSTTDGIDLSNAYIVDNDLAPIMSVSYGECELGMGTAGNQFYDQLWQQAAAEGISVFVASGDGGSAACDQGGQDAQYGLAVNGTASPSYVTAVGGTDFLDLETAAKYWSATNNSTTLASALRYVPETVWNDSCTNSEFSLITGSSNPTVNCNNAKLQSALGVVGGGGGLSACTTSDGQTAVSCAGGYPAPAWQAGLSAGGRELPDVSLFAGNGLNNNFYLLCWSGECANSSSPTFTGVGGTSAAAPNWAGIQALVDQKMGGRQGDVDPILYRLNQSQTESACNASTAPASSCIFNNVTNGTNAQPCNGGSPDCSTPPAGDRYGILSGYNAGPGYNPATGLGTPNIANLVAAWANLSFVPSAASLTASPENITHGQSVNLSVTVSAQNPAANAPGGVVAILSSKGFTADVLTLNSAGQINATTSQLPGGSYALTANYPGDGTYAPAISSPVSMTVSPEPDTVSLNVSDNASGTPPPATQPFGAYVNLESVVTGKSGVGVPTGNVTFDDNGVAVQGNISNPNPVSLDAGGTAQFFGYYPVPGDHLLTAAYAGDNSFQAAASSSVSFQITKGPTAVFVSNGSNQNFIYGIGQEFINSVNDPDLVRGMGYGPGITPTGTVQVYLNGKPLGSPVPPNTTMSVSAGALPWGPAVLSAAYSGDNNFLPSAGTWNVNFTAPADAAIAASASRVQVGGNVNITVTLTPQVTGGPPMTGNVVFTVIGSMTGAATVPVSQQAAQYALSNIPAGNVGVYAEYSGDDYYGAAQTTQVNVLAVSPDFSLNSVGGISVTSPGNSATAAISTVAIGGFTGAITFSCSGLPALSSCVFNPASVAVGSPATLTITTTGPASGAAPPAIPPNRWIPGSLLLGLGFLLFAFGRSAHGRRRPALGPAVLLLAMLLTASGCGGSNSAPIPTPPPPAPSTPTGTFILTITGASGSLTHSVTTTLTVQ